MSNTDFDIEKYDFNFYFPVRPLENEKVKLTPFIPDVHLKEVVSGFQPYPEMFGYLPACGPFDTEDDFLNFFTPKIHNTKEAVLFVVYNKSPEGALSFAGVIGYVNTSLEHQCTEIGFVCTIPPFQRTHVTTNAVGLLLQYGLELPSPSSPLASSSASSTPPFPHQSTPLNPKHSGGLGLRRMVWQTHHDNTPSLRAAERLGFRREGLIRWQRVLRSDKTGAHVPQDRAKLCDLPGRHSWMLSVCWDDWELEGVREKVQGLMDR
ncbi:acyl- N-acyltransferase [Pyrrhoderma noxium]|uniref:Acyl-N-acyltransferase n=1 Tax=Pyrrhoderma noxium TaxID=2282107 RepID=A0A286UTC4_9AGAM|nr:acyl- N-acyltransferase [Pyrrhoderma noxium]